MQIIWQHNQKINKYYVYNKKVRFVSSSVIKQSAKGDKMCEKLIILTMLYDYYVYYQNNLWGNLNYLGATQRIR